MDTLRDKEEQARRASLRTLPRFFDEPRPHDVGRLLEEAVPQYEVRDVSDAAAESVERLLSHLSFAGRRQPVIRLSEANLYRGFGPGPVSPSKTAYDIVVAFKPSGDEAQTIHYVAEVKGGAHATELENWPIGDGQEGIEKYINGVLVRARALFREIQPDRVKRIAKSMILVMRLAPEAGLRGAALQALGAFDRPKSRWADAIGPVYSMRAMALAVRVPEEELRKAATMNAVLAMESTEGDLYFPVPQVGRNGGILAGLRPVLEVLSGDVIDRYSLSTWMNKPRCELDGRSPWEELRSSPLASSTRLLKLAENFGERLSQ